MDPFGPLQTTAMEEAHMCVPTYDHEASIDSGKECWTLCRGFHY